VVATLTEHQEAVVLADWMRHKGLLFAHVPNEARRSHALAARLKREGLSPGVPDYLIFSLPPRYQDARGVAIELKRCKGAKPTKHQREWLQALLAQGWECNVCYGADAAISWLRSLGW